MLLLGGCCRSAQKRNVYVSFFSLLFPSGRSSLNVCCCCNCCCCFFFLLSTHTVLRLSMTQNKTVSLPSLPSSLLPSLPPSSQTEGHTYFIQFLVLFMLISFTSPPPIPLLLQFFIFFPFLCSSSHTNLIILPLPLWGCHRLNPTTASSSSSGSSSYRSRRRSRRRTRSHHRPLRFQAQHSPRPKPPR